MKRQWRASNTAPVATIDLTDDAAEPPPRKRARVETETGPPLVSWTRQLRLDELRPAATSAEEEGEEEEDVVSEAELQRRFQKRTRLQMWQTLTVDQRRALLLVKSRARNVFITGEGGTGKSWLLRALIAHLPAARLGITAPTGAAATNVGGTTIHWFASLGVGRDPVDELVDKILHARFAVQVRERIRDIDWLLIDEISMMPPALLETLDTVFRRVRGCNRPMGGVTCVFCGDFLQLPPVVDRHAAAPPPGTPRFAFQAPAWAALSLVTVELQGSHRQSDPDFLAILNELRLGTCSAETEGRLKALVQPVGRPSGAGEPELVSHLYSHNADVDAENKQRLARLPADAEMHFYEAIDMVDKERGGKQDMLDKMRVPKVLELKHGAQVMLVYNVDVEHGLANGTSGRVVGFANDSAHSPLVDFGHGPVAVTTMEFSVKERNHVIVSRRQVPLVLAWALTVHKVQGQTIKNKAVLDLGPRIFEYGQAYVALSRMCRLEDVRLAAFDRAAIKAHPIVLAWLAQQRAPPLLLAEKDDEEEDRSTAVPDMGAMTPEKDTD